MDDETAPDALNPNVIVAIMVMVFVVAAIVLAAVMLSRGSDPVNAGSSGTTGTPSSGTGPGTTGAPSTTTAPGGGPTSVPTPTAPGGVPACNATAPLPRPNQPQDYTVELNAALAGCPEAQVEARAKATGWTTRVVSRDGEDFMVTMDYNASRLNLTVVNGVVTGVTTG
jgi:hypothetical protein